MVAGRMKWDAPSTWPENTDRLRAELRKKLHDFEARYELSSERLEAELAAGRLRETAEVCEWLIAYRTYQALVHERPA